MTFSSNHGLASGVCTFLLLHGIPGSAANWDGVAARLREGGHAVLAPDLLGFRGTDVPSGRDALLAPSQARHVLAVLDEAGIERVVLAGHDFGGPVAAHLLDQAPARVEALALFATNAFPDTPIPFPLSMLGSPVLGGLVGRLLFSRPALTMMVRRGMGDPRPVVDMADYLGDAQQHAAISTIFANSLRRLRELYTPVERALGAARVPALVGWGDHDPFFPVAVGRRTAGALHDARLRIYEDAGHFLPEERPNDLAADLLELAATARVA